MRPKIVHSREDLARLVAQYQARKDGSTAIRTSPVRAEIWRDGHHIATIVVNASPADRGE